MSPSLLHPKCAMAWGGVSRCERCGNMPWICLDYSARKAQEAARLVCPTPDAPTPSTPPTGAVAPLPWRFEDMSVLSSDPGAYGPVASYVDDADGAFIIKAANHHAALVGALEATISWWSAWSDAELPDALRDAVLLARALLARVRGEP